MTQIKAPCGEIVEMGEVPSKTANTQDYERDMLSVDNIEDECARCALEWAQLIIQAEKENQLSGFECPRNCTHGSVTNSYES